MRVRSPTRSSRWSTSRRSSRSSPSRRATGRSPRAVRRAQRPAHRSHPLAVAACAVACVRHQLRRTRTMRSPALSRSPSSRRERCRRLRPPTSCRGRSSQPSRELESSSELVPKLARESSRPCSSQATAVCVRLCASIPMITIGVSPSIEGTSSGSSVGTAQSRSSQAPLKPHRPVPSACAGRTSDRWHRHLQGERARAPAQDDTGLQGCAPP